MHERNIMLRMFLTHPFRHRSHFGFLIIFGSVLLSYALWLGSMAWFNDWYEDPWKYPAKVGSHGSLLLMCWAFLLATRLGPVEWLFGGLDKVYHAHRVVGEAAFLLIFLHPVFLAMHRAADGLASYFGYFTAWQNPVITTGLLALAVFVFLVVLSIYWKIAYHRWKKTHDFFGLLFALVLLHGIWAHGEIMRYPVLRWWFGIWCLLGASAYLYVRFFYHWIGPLYDHRVSRVRAAGNDITEVYFQPMDRPLRHEPGQFVYVSFDSDAVSREPHPFTIASGAEDPAIRLCIKALGDWTTDVAKIRDGEPARLWGPYGHLGEALWQNPGREAVFLAGGIGVTPFLGLLSSAKVRKRPGAMRMIYSVQARDKAVYESELKELCAAAEQVEFFPHYTEEEGFIDEKWLTDRVGNLRGPLFFLCGPGPMNEAMKNLLLKAGVDLRDLHFEVFSIR
jgi:predicted ferric reductase